MDKPPMYNTVVLREDPPEYMVTTYTVKNFNFISFHLKHFDAHKTSPSGSLASGLARLPYFIFVGTH